MECEALLRSVQSFPNSGLVNEDGQEQIRLILPILANRPINSGRDHHRSRHVRRRIRRDSLTALPAAEPH